MNVTYPPGASSAVGLSPVGVAVPYGGSSEPGGQSDGSEWLLANGQAISRTSYATLFTLYGTTYGVGNGSTTFNLPDLRRRVPVGAGGTGTGELGNSIGDTGGAEAHTLETSEIPSHQHEIWETGLYNSYTSDGSDGTGISGSGSSQTYNTQSIGGGGSHNNLQPSLVMNYIIRVK